MIQNIEIERLHAHPHNPRKDLGDLAELAESIKARGVLQNLTVVPWFSAITGHGCDDPKSQKEMGYTVVIGHRRLAAAKLAGLTEVPCAITDMDPKQQLATMLLENIQRSDLTLYEQAQGFQMMLDLGEFVSGIAEKTGFSESTIRRRVKLLELDQERLKKSMDRGATLMDYAKLEEIEDVETRNKVLDSIGTSNFQWELKNAIDKEKDAKNMAILIDKLKKFASETEKEGVYIRLLYVGVYYPRNAASFEAPEDAGETKYYYVPYTEYGYVSLFKERVYEAPQAQDPELAKRLEARDRSRKGLADASALAYRLRQDFAMNLSNADAKKNLDVIAEHSARCILDDCNYAQSGILEKALDIKLNDEDLDFDYIRQRVFKQPERVLFLAVYCRIDSVHKTYTNWNGISHKTNSQLDRAYDFLQDIGYKMSDEERKLQDGTHEFFVEEM